MQLVVARARSMNFAQKIDTQLCAYVGDRSPNEGRGVRAIPSKATRTRGTGGITKQGFYQYKFETEG